MYSEVQRILVDDVPVLWLADTKSSTLLNKRVHDAVTTALGVVDTQSDTWLSKE
ncbi:hypothetical protein D3C85_1581850 [compost metagenome]